MNNNQNVGNNQPINQTNTNQFNGQIRRICTLHIHYSLLPITFEDK